MRATGRISIAACATVLASTCLGTLGQGNAAAPRPADGLGAPTASGPSSAFSPVGPFRLADTRQAACECSRSAAGTIRVVIAGRNGIPADIVAAAVTVTATASAAGGFVTVFPAGGPRPDTSTLNLAARSDASNSTIVRVGDGGALDLYASAATDLIVDVTGVFTAAATATAGRFEPAGPLRLVDTRDTLPAGIQPGGSITVALPAGISSDATAVAVNVTSVEAPGPGFVSGHAAGSPAPPTSFLNPDGSGAARAASVILPVSPLGLTIDASAGGHIVVDLLGWFTGPSSPPSAEGLLVPVTPIRLLDTRAVRPRLWEAGTREVPLPEPAAGALVANVTLTSADGAGYVTAYPAGQARPTTSSLNAPGRDATVANFAITTVSTRGSAYYSSRGTDLVVDMTGYFTGTPTTADLPVPADIAPDPRVLMIGDSTLGSLIDVKSSQSALRSFEPVIDALPCRRLVRPSCTSRFTLIAPNTAVQAINGASGPFDAAIIKAGYNESAQDFAGAVAAVVGAARAKGARIIIWLTYSESTKPGTYDSANAVLKTLAGSAAFPDLVVADWRAYAAGSNGWYATDRVHLLLPGAWATADYLSRWVADVFRLPCPVAWSVGGPIADPCPNPDAYAATTGTLPELRSLYGF